jgi:hypothetical protein
MQNLSQRSAASVQRKGESKDGGRMTLPTPPKPGQKRRPPHRSFDPLRAHDPETLARAVVLHKDGEYDAAWTLYLKLDTESVSLGRGPHYHARMMAALLWYQRTSKIDFSVDPNLPKHFGAAYRTVTGMLRDVIYNRPKWADPVYNLGVILEGLGQIEEAERRFERAVTIDSAYAEAWVNLGNCKLHKGDVAEARKCFEIAETLNPDDALAKYNLMHALALFGEWDAAYERYEYRYLVPGHLRDHGLPRRVPRWDGVSYVNHLVVTDEQGAGDILQFVRFLPYLEARVGKVSCRVRHPSLLPLLQPNYPNVQFFGQEDRIPKADAHQPLLSCINTLQVHEQDVPLPQGYLQPPPPTSTGVQTQGIVWKHPSSNTETVAHTAPLRVGVCWAGSPGHKRDATRSIPFADFSKILDVPGIAFTNLTVGDRAKVEHPALTSPELTDYAVTARVMAGLDLVVTIDSSVLHLAGALGVPTWGLIGASPDMRWGLAQYRVGKKDTAFYDSVKLLRQPHHGDWDTVLGTVRKQLTEMAHGRA